MLGHNESFLVDRADPNWQHIRPFRWWLLPHGLAGACALLLAPLGVYIQYLEEPLGGARSFTIATLVDAVLLTSTAAMALFFIRRRKIQQHRQWMTRSYAVVLVFSEVRAISGIFGLDDTAGATETIVWCCVAAALPLADLVLQLQESWRTGAQVRA